MIKGVVLDLDGTVYRGKTEVPGAARFIEQLKEQGMKPLFVTNRSNRTPEHIRAQLNDCRIDCATENILTSAHATVRYIKQGTVFCIGEEGLVRALEEAGLTITDQSPDYVVVGFDRSFTYEKMKKACNLICNGAKYIATNPDKALRIENGVLPGTGAIVAAITAGSGVEPVIIGKPEKLIIEMALDRLGMRKEEVIAVGDNLETDIPAGAQAGVRTALILTGISTREDIAGSPVKPTWIVENYEELTGIVLGTGS